MKMTTENWGRQIILGLVLIGTFFTNGDTRTILAIMSLLIGIRVVYSFVRGK